jgi:hypothetical protein
MINKDTTVPTQTLVVVPQPGIDKEDINKLLIPLTEIKKRDWFTSHFYYCLPLSIGNIYGFIVKAERDITVHWNGEESIHGLVINQKHEDSRCQRFDGHFGSGILTIQNLWHYRTPPGVNLMTITPPNFPQHGLMHMTGVIETDNLSRDFTFNLKVTKPNIYVTIKAGDPIGAFIPIPRYFADRFTIKYADELFTPEEIDLEYKTGAELARQRQQEDILKPHAAGRKYFKGTDAWDNPFPDHQKK